MGMFNYVDFRCFCPRCGEPVDGFQTKSSKTYLYCSTVSPEECDDFYSECRKCGLWIEFEHDDGVVRFGATLKALRGD